MLQTDDPLYEEVKRRVATAKQQGVYSPALEDELVASFGQIVREMHGERHVDDEQLLALVESVKTSLRSVTGLTPVHSRVPGGTFVHRVIRRLIARQTQGLAQQVESLFLAQQQLIESLVERSILTAQRDTRLVAAMSQHVIERLAHLEHLERRVQLLETSVEVDGSDRRVDGSL